MILVVLLLNLAALCASTAYAQTIYFNYSYTVQCQYDCPPLYLNVDAGGASDSVTIATVNSDVPGYTDPVPINGGLLKFQTLPSLDWLYGQYESSGSYIPGGSASITGSVFGLPDGATLLTASFQSASGYVSYYPEYPGRNAGGKISIIYINPVLLDNLGLHGAPNCGTGSLSDSYSYDNDTHDWGHGVQVTFTPGTCYASSVLHNFAGGSDGASPIGGLTLDAAGNLYGTAQGGGRGFGTVWKLQHAAGGWIFNPLYQFTGGNDGAGPVAGVVFGPDGTLYGTTAAGGKQNCSGNFPYPGCGTVFNLKPPPRACATALCPWKESVLYSFMGDSDGANPTANVIFDQSGTLYGTTQFGGSTWQSCTSGCGTIFQLAPSGNAWIETVLTTFTTDGLWQPRGGVTIGPLGNIFGTTFYGGGTGCGGNGCGGLFGLYDDYNFSDSDGGNSAAGVILDQSGNLYGATSGFGPAGGGSIFVLPWGSPWKFALIAGFSGNPGDGPWNLVMDQAGNLYAATQRGGAHNYGAVVKLTPYTPLHDFTGGSDGAYPVGGLVVDKNGNIYGTTSAGGKNGLGVVFEITPK
jgi:uncharacterized repeat protein (TIGR03803 family)